CTIQTSAYFISLSSPCRLPSSTMSHHFKRARKGLQEFAPARPLIAGSMRKENPMPTTPARFTRCLTTLAVRALCSPAARGAAITWDAGGAPDLEWSVFDTFSHDDDPDGHDLTFNDTGASGTEGDVTSIVDADRTVNSLHF